MSNNIENDRSNSTTKMYPIDLAVAPQKITIVKSMSNAEVKMTHLITGQPKTSGSGQLITHAGPVGLMRTATQIITPGVSSQPQMIVSGPPIIQGTPIISQGSQLIGQTSQIITQSQLINSSGQIITPGTQIISQGSQLSAQVSNSNNSVSNNIAPSIASSVSGTQVLNVGGQLVSGSSSLVVSSSVRTLPPSVRVLPPLPLHNNRPVLSTVNVSTASGVLVSKGVTSHVPRGLAAGASLAVRPVTPLASSQSVSNQGGGAWSSSSRGRSALVYGGRSTLPRSTAPRALTPTPTPASPTPAPASTPTPQPNQSPHSTIISLPTSTVLTSSGVISNNVRGPAPRTPTPTPISTTAPPRPLPLLQRNYQPTKVVGVASVGVRGVVGNSAPSQLYYEVPRGTQHSITQHQVPLQNQHQIQHQAQLQVQHQTQMQTLSRPLTPYNHTQPSVQVSVVNTVQSINENRQIPTPLTSSAILPRPSILRKREIDGSPSKLSNIVTSGGGSGNISSVSIYRETNAAPGWEDIPSGIPGPGSGSTTMSASSSPPHDEPDPPRAVPDLSPRKKPRKQMLSNEVRQCEFTAEEAPPTPPPTVNPLPKRPQLSSSYVCGWRGTALHFVRPADVRRREPRARDILAIASQRHVLASADGWKVHHLTAQMEDLVSLEADVGEQLAGVLRAIENASGRALTAIQPHSHTLLELIKGNIQRSKIVCEGIQEAREDILRVFKHRNFVSDILTRQADKRCFRKHRSQS